MKVFIVAAITPDGFIAEDAGHNSRDWRSKEDGKSFSRLIKWAGVAVMGSTTYKTFRINRALFGQKLYVYTHDPSSIFLGKDTEATYEDPRQFVERMAQAGHKGVAICGGTMINTLFLKAGVVDELYLTIEPALFGKGVPLLSEEWNGQLTLLDSTTYSSGSIRVHYAVNA